MEAGTLGWTKAREIIRVTTPETEDAWLARAAARTSRLLEREVSLSQRGDLPPKEGEPEPAPARGRVCFELEAADRAVLLDALAVFRARSGLSAAEVEDGEVLAAMAWFVIGHAEATTSPIEGEAAGHAAGETALAEHVAPASAAVASPVEPVSNLPPVVPTGGGERADNDLARCRWRRGRSERHDSGGSHL